MEPIDNTPATPATETQVATDQQTETAASNEDRVLKLIEEAERRGYRRGLEEASAAASAAAADAINDAAEDSWPGFLVERRPGFWD